MCCAYQSRYGRPFFNATLMIFNRLIEPPQALAPQSFSWHVAIQI